MKTSAKTRTVPFARRRHRRALTLIEALVVLAFLAVLAGVLLPPLARVNGHQRVNCLNNLKQVGIAFRFFATDHNGRFPQRLSSNEGGTLELAADITAHFRVLSNDLAVPQMLHCPKGAGQPATNFTTLTASNISYFIGLEAEESQPQMILAGDDNLTTNGVTVGSGWLIPRPNLVVGYGKDRHASWGNVVMSDGSAHQLTSERLPEILRQPPNLTNRFLLP